MTCTATTSNCACIRADGHAPPHVCACRGAWWVDGTHVFVPYAIPNTLVPPLQPEQADAYAETLHAFTFEEAVSALVHGLAQLVETIDNDASIGDLRRMRIGDLDVRRN